MTTSTQVTMPAKITAFGESMVNKLRSNFNEVEYQLTALYEAQDKLTSSSSTEIRQAITGAVTGGKRINRPSL